MFRSGQQVGLYTLIVKLGRGGFGEVWLAEKRSQFVTKKVAVKLPHEEQVNFDAIHQEATLWEQASGHPNVLPIIDADVYDGQVVIVSEYADGGSLADRLKREEKLSVKQSVEMTIGILSGLEFLHSRKIIHRDIKPQNILLQGNTPRLADFGISRAMNTTVVSSAIIGTDAYMSPESFDGKRNAQTDIWSVGVVLYQLLKGSLPFPQEHPSERMFAVLTKEFEPLPDELPSDLRRIVQKALAKQPENRFQSAEEMREDLQKALIGIAHPTLAKTEVFIKPNLPVDESSAPTLADVNNETQATEIRTVVSNAPVNQTPPRDQQFSSEPAPTQAAYQQNSVATQINQTPAATNQLVQAANSANNSAASSTRKRNLAIIFVGIGAIFILFAAISLNWAVKYLSRPTYPPELQKRIDKAKEKDPYYVYTDREPFESNKKYGYKNSKGEIIIPAKYDGADFFSNGLAPVKLGEKYGYIDENDNVVVPLKYELAFYFNENLAVVQQNGKWGFINISGKEITPFKYESHYYGFFEGLAAVKLNGKWGFIDRNGKEAIPLKYNDASLFSQSLAAVQMDDKWGFIDKNGNTVIPFKYEKAYYFNEDLAWVKLNGKYGFIDKTDKEIIPIKFGDGMLISRFEEGLAGVCLGAMNTDSCGFIDKTGREVVPLKYDYAYGFSEDLAAVEKDDKWGFVDKNGVVVIPIKYDSGGFFTDSYAKVKLNGRELRIDKNGSETDIGASNTNTNTAGNTATSN